MNNSDITFRYLSKLFDRANLEEKKAIVLIKDMLLEEEKPTCEHSWGIIMRPNKPNDLLKCIKCGMVKE